MVGQIGLFEEARVKIEDPEPMTTVRVGSRVAKIPLHKKRREALKKLMEILEELEQLKATAIAEIDSLDNLRELDDWRVRYLGRKGSLTSMLRGLRALSLEERRTSLVPSTVK